MLNSFFFIISCRLLGNVEKCFRAGQATDDSMVYAHCIPKATNTCSECVILIVFSLQQRLQERVSFYIVRALCTLLVISDRKQCARHCKR